MRIHEFVSSAGITFMLYPSYILTQLGMDWAGPIVDFGTSDMPHLSYVYQDDLHINTGPNGQGIQENDADLKKEEFTGTIGLLTRASNYQAYLFNVTPVSI
jgi:hypothetical protein